MCDKNVIEVWQEPVHAELFSAKAHFSLALLRVYESFEEFGVLLDHKDWIQGREHVVCFC